ncbi:hypothetical protein RYZ27_03860 [Hyphomonas sp. FCG-A18]|jgi:uncharacterized membrane protein|uniref:hypothetical protein n=1 Tax=Hyphomonas sp. FCG-A18 TaxID=3080019 RepID=UPI002B2E3BC9|nr:hypothetical protein RYZ27_03860 [Hyphomonas sp. FCG-A18]
MSERGQTNGWFLIGMTLIILGAGIYGLLTLLGVSFAIGAASAETGAPLWVILIIPGLVAVGFLILILKVIIDRLGNAEDDYYSKNIDK